MLVSADLVDFCEECAVEALPAFPDSRELMLSLGGMEGHPVESSRAAKKAGDAWLREHPDACLDPELALKRYNPDLVVYSFTTSGPAVQHELATMVPAVPAFFHRSGLQFFEAYASMPPSRPSFLATSPLVDTEPPLPISLDPVQQTGVWWLDPNAEAKVDSSHLSTMAELLSFLEAGAPPVAVGWGSMIARRCPPRQLLLLALRALRYAERRAVIIGGWSHLDELGKELVSTGCLSIGIAEDEEEDLPELVAFATEQCFFTRSVSHAWLFPRCSAAVHHGGSGTTHAALLAGKPAVVTPIFYDQFDFARAVERLGAGVGFEEPLPEITPDSLAEAILRAETCTAAAEAVALRLRAEDGVSEAAATIRSFLRDEVVSGRWRAACRSTLRQKEGEKAAMQERSAARSRQAAADKQAAAGRQAAAERLSMDEDGEGAVLVTPRRLEVLPDFADRVHRQLDAEALWKGQARSGVAEPEPEVEVEAAKLAEAEARAEEARKVAETEASRLQEAQARAEAAATAAAEARRAAKLEAQRLAEAKRQAEAKATWSSADEAPKQRTPRTPADSGMSWKRKLAMGAAKRWEVDDDPLFSDRSDVKAKRRTADTDEDSQQSSAAERSSAAKKSVAAKAAAARAARRQAAGF